MKKILLNVNVRRASEAKQSIRGVKYLALLICFFTLKAVTVVGQFWSPYGPDIYNSNTGNVGIGTAAPGGRLDVQSASTTVALRVGSGRFSMNGTAKFEIDAPGIVGGRFSILSNGNVGIGIVTPGSRLEVNSGTAGVSGLQFTQLNSSSATVTANGKALSVDASGKIILVPTATGSFWNITGNAGTNSSSNFIGTIDDVDLIFKRNNVRAGFIGTDNTSFGNSALNLNTTGYNNTAHGVNALYSNTTGYGNTAIGVNALSSNTMGYENTANGGSALSRNTGGSINTAHGVNALYSNTTGFYNTANGYRALYSNTDGSNNTALGTNANVATGSLTNATAIGNGSIVNASNSIQLGNAAVTTVLVGTGTTAKLIAGGLQITGGTLAAGKVLTSDASGNGTWQTGGWNLTGNAGTSSSSNFIGTTDDVDLIFKRNNERAGFIGTINTGNTSFGTAALSLNTTGQANTANGLNALGLNTAGSENTANGYYALYNNNTTSSKNTANGTWALFNNTAGGSNTANGYQALYSNTTGSFNTALGQNADVSSGNLTNATAIGYNAVVNANNKIRLGNGSVSVVEGPTYSTVSDGRFKNNISESDVKGLEFINRLRPVVYNFDTRRFNEFLTHNMPDSIRARHSSEEKNFRRSTAIRQSGFIAQEVEKAAKDVGYDFNGVHVPESKDDNYSLAYSQFTVPLVKAVQELSKQNEEMKKEIEELRQLIKSNSGGSVGGPVLMNGSMSEAKLFQNAPNPFTQSTTILYSLPAAAKKAVLSITSVNGAKLKEYNLVNNNSKTVEIAGGQFAAGTYIYSLIVDNVLVDSKKMILTH